MLAPPIPDRCLAITLNKENHEIAHKFALEQSTIQKSKEVYLNTLAVLAVQSFLEWIGVENDLEASDSWHPAVRCFHNVADLVIPNIGKLECRPVIEEETIISWPLGATGDRVIEEETIISLPLEITLPLEVTEDRIAYIGVLFQEYLNEVQLLGFCQAIEPQPEKIQIASLEPIENLIDLIDHLESSQFSLQRNQEVEIEVEQTMELDIIQERSQIQRAAVVDYQSNDRGNRLVTNLVGGAEQTTNLLETHPAIQQALVAHCYDGDGKNRLVAYLVGYLAIDRIPIQSQCWCEDQNGDRVKLLIVDISHNGICLLNTPRSWSLGKIIYLYLHLPDMPEPVRIPAKVVWHQRPQFSLKTLLETLGFNTTQSNPVRNRTGVLFDPAFPAINLIRHTVKNISQNIDLSVQDLCTSELRVPLHTNVRVCFADGRSFGWETENISLTGIRIRGVDGIWKKGTELQLFLRLPGSTVKLNLRATVWWHKGSQAGLRLHLTPQEEAVIHEGIQYIIFTQGLSLESLRQFLTTNLPPELIPSHFVILEEMPLDAQGKIDTLALPQPNFLL